MDKKRKNLYQTIGQYLIILGLATGIIAKSCHEKKEANIPSEFAKRINKIESIIPYDTLRNTYRCLNPESPHIKKDTLIAEYITTKGEGLVDTLASEDRNKIEDSLEDLANVKHKMYLQDKNISGTTYQDVEEATTKTINNINTILKGYDLRCMLQYTSSSYTMIQFKKI